MINDDDVIQDKINIDIEISEFSEIYKKDDMSSITIEGRSNICTDYFDTTNSRNYFKKNFEDTEKVNGPPYLVGLALCNTSSSYKHISMDEIDVHLVMAKFVTTLTRSQKCQFALILNLINEKQINNLKHRMNVNVKDEYSTTNKSDLQGCDKQKVRDKLPTRLIIFIGIVL